MSLLDRLAARWRRRWVIGAGLAVAATGVLVAVVTNPWLGLVAASVLGLICWRRRTRVDAATIARHLNRVIPALEESADLLVIPEASLGPLERLQRARVERVVTTLLEPALPARGFRVSLAYSAGALVLAAGVAIAGQTAGRSDGRTLKDPAAGAAASWHADGPVRIVSVDITVQPPAYTGRRTRRGADWDLDVEQGARVTWRVRLNRPVSDARLVTSDGDSVPFTLESARRAEYEAAVTAGRSQLYQAVTTELHRLTVIPDRAPTLTVVRPEPRTAIAPADSRVVPLEVLAADDYGVTDARIIATVTTGSGEGVLFREQVLEFDGRTARRQDGTNGFVLRKDLDLHAFGMNPGDELYFHITARDNRAPEPNETRSETYFVTLTDTATVVVAELAGFAVNRLPEYFRSQRQIIIDTERLLAERPRLTTQEFNDRSNNIGIDQHLLRERYAEIVGDETVESGPEPEVSHEHDIEENATRLAQSVKGTLRQAVGAMWEAEGRLRTYEPAAALPFEYRALELLKAVQQAARLFVLRVGFEPPPLEPDRKRLSGTLTGIGRPSRTRTVTGRDSLAAVRAALTFVQRLHGAPTGADLALLEAAGRDIARLAVDDPGRHLETLRDLRALIDSLSGHSGVRPCGNCLARAERGLWRTLPSPAPARAARPVAGSGLVGAYFGWLR